MAYRNMWEIEIRHDGLNKYRHIRGSDRHVVEQKAIAQQLVWDEMWEKKLEAEQKRREREEWHFNKERKKESAVIETQEAQEKIKELEALLQYTLNINDTIDWDSLLDKQVFPDKKPAEPRPHPSPREPLVSDKEFQPKIGLLDKLFKSFRTKKELAAELRFHNAHEAWENEKASVDAANKKLYLTYSEASKKWKDGKANFEEAQAESNNNILEKKRLYFGKDSDAVLDYCEMVLANSKYPDFFPQDWYLDYQPDSQILVVDYSLPDIESFPTIKEVKYIAARDEFTKSTISNAALNKLYDEALYQIALRTIHELYEADVVNALSSIVFNGWVNSIDKATGQNVNSCIMSIQASKDEFLAINLEKVDPKACFKQLKGVGSSKLHGLSAIAPIISINKEDSRFISSYEVVEGLSEADNLAAMDWQDFENLIREVFEKEFVSSGGEVKITQASRDGGVDAIAFDPDPIRGGKIVIQAKRYTNVVGVSAVRDLYGTTVNEGATKGILVTTADYGPDAYEFAKGKNITLLNGSNLLHLLEKHGHKVKIDLKEAKMILAEQKLS